MNDSLQQDFSKFSDLLEEWTGAYQCAVIAYVGLKRAQGFRVLFGRILLETSRSGINDTPFIFETEHVIAARFVAGAQESDIAVLLENAKRGEIPRTVSGGTFSLEGQGNLSAFFAPIHHPLISDGPRLPSLIISGSPKHDLIGKSTDPRQLDWELKAGDIPFDNLDELLSHCALPMINQMGDSVTLEVVARSPGWISDASIIKDNDAIIECRVADAIDLGKLRIGYKIFGQNIVDRASVIGSTLEWRQENDIKTGICRVRVGNASVLQAFLSYAGTSLHQWWITDPQKRLNPRHAIHQIFDEDIELLKQMLLKPETDKPYAFESAVSTILNILGFSVSNYGRIPKLQKGPDIVAVSPSGHIGVIECTVGLLDENDKLAKLVQRTKLIRDKLNQTGYGSLEVQPVIVTPLSRDEVKANLETAGKNDIAVVCRENLEVMLNQINLPPNADRLFQEAKKLVPSAGQKDLLVNK
jgi:hypothetical protein